jgi:hypothetical protein
VKVARYLGSNRTQTRHSYTQLAKPEGGMLPSEELQITLVWNSFKTLCSASFGGASIWHPQRSFFSSKKQERLLLLIIAAIAGLFAAHTRAIHIPPTHAQCRIRML